MPKISQDHQNKIKKKVSNRRKTRDFADPVFPNRIVQDYSSALIKEINNIDSLIKEILFPHLDKITGTKDERLDSTVKLDIELRELAGVALVSELIRRIKSKFFGEIIGTDSEPTQRLFTKSIRKISSKFLNQTKEFTEKRFTAEFERQTGTKPLEKHLNVDIFVDESIARNVNLIKTLPSRYLARVSDLAIDAVGRGQLSRDLKQELLKIKDVTKNQSRLLARDQIGKMTGILNEARQRNLNVKEYIWRTSNDSRVRSFANSNGASDHARLEGTIQKWSVKPQTVFKGKRAGERNHPSEDIQCFPKGTMIKVENGEKPIEEIKIGDIVHSHWGLQKVVETHKKRYQGELTGIKFLHKTVWLTPRHKIFTVNRGWIEPCHLKASDKIMELKKLFTCNFFHKEVARDIEHPHPHLISQKQMSFGVDFTHDSLNFYNCVKFFKHKIRLVINTVFSERFFKNPLRIIFNTKHIEPSCTNDLSRGNYTTTGISRSWFRGCWPSLLSPFWIFNPLSNDGLAPVSNFDIVMDKNSFNHSACHSGNFGNVSVRPKFFNVFIRKPLFKRFTNTGLNFIKSVKKISLISAVFGTINSSLSVHPFLSCGEHFIACLTRNVKSFTLHNIYSKIVNNNVFKRHLHYEVVGLESQEFNGFVYNFGVDKSMSYFAEGLLVENCRCSAQPVFDEITGIPHKDTIRAREKSNL